MVISQISSYLNQLLSSWNRNNLSSDSAPRRCVYVGVDKEFRKPFLRKVSIPLWYVFFRVSKLDTNYGKQVELLFSREENPPCSWTRTRSSKRHPGGGRLYNSHKLCPTVPENRCFMLDINLGAASTICISAKVLFVKNLPQQVSRRQPPPPLVVVCPPPSPRLVNVHGEEELDFRNSSTLCLWSLDPRRSGHEESGIPVEVNWCP